MNSRNKTLFCLGRTNCRVARQSVVELTWQKAENGRFPGFDTVNHRLHSGQKIKEIALRWPQNAKNFLASQGRRSQGPRLTVPKRHPGRIAHPRQCSTQRHLPEFGVAGFVWTLRSWVEMQGLSSRRTSARNSFGCLRARLARSFDGYKPVTSVGSGLLYSC